MQALRSPDQTAGLGSRRAVQRREERPQRRIVSGAPLDDVFFGRWHPCQRERDRGRQRSTAEMNVMAGRTARRTLMAGVVLVLGIVHGVGAERDKFDEVRRDVTDPRKLEDRNDRQQPDERHHHRERAGEAASSPSRCRGVRTGLW